MRTFLTFFLFLICLATGVRAQDIRLIATQGFGPFSNGSGVTNTFRVNGLPLRSVIDSVLWQIVCHDGPDGALRVVRSARTSPPLWQTSMSDLPFLPNPTVTTTVYYSVSGMRTSRQLSAAIEMNTPNIALTATNDWAAIPIGMAFTGRYGIQGCPPGTSRIVLYLQSGNGRTLDSVVRTGTNLDTATIRYSTPSHDRGRSFQAVLSFPGAPPNGFVMERPIPDVVPAVQVKSSLGMGPFVSGRDAFTTFTIDSTLGSYVGAVFTFGLNGRYGAQHRISEQLVPWTHNGDRFQVTVNMGQLPAYATLRVEMLTVADSVVSTHIVPISIVPAVNPPDFSMHRGPTLMYQSHGVDSVMIDSLPARTVMSHLAIISPEGKTITDITQRAGASAFLRRASLRFDGGALPLHIHTVRATFWSDYDLDPQEYEYYFTVRDTALPNIYATNFGPFIQSDSATLSIGISDLRPPATPLADRYGWFQIVDTLSRAVLQRSDTFSLNGVGRTDSLWWEDERQSRELVQAAPFTVNAGIEFIDAGVRNDGSIFTTTYTHPLMMVPRPGVITASAGYGPFMAGRTVMNTFRIDSLPEDVRSVEFAVTGTENSSQIDSLMVTQVVNRTAQFTTNMGLLPINARLQVTIRTKSGSERGITLERFLYVIPDSLNMQSRVSFDALALDWQSNAVGSTVVQRISGPRPFMDTLTFRRLPAQTETISIATYDDGNHRIDSISFDVPYRVRFDESLVARVPFTYRSFATSRIEIRVYTTGGLADGVTFTYPVVVKNPSIAVAVRRYRPSGSLDAQPIQHRASEIMDITTRVVLPGIFPVYGFGASTVIDSVRIRLVDCRGGVIDSLSPTPARSSPSSTIISSISYPSSHLPLTSARAEVRVYSKMLTFPDSGFAFTDILNIIPGPIAAATLEGDFPTFRINDTVRTALYNPYSIANLFLVDSVSNIRVVDRLNRVVARYTTRIPIHDSVRFTVNVDSAAFPPGGSPFRVLAQADYTTCSDRRSLHLEVGTFSVSRQFPDPAQDFFIWSSAGWGPFRQGRSQFTQFMQGLRPSYFIPSRNTAYDDELRIQIRSMSADSSRVQWTYLDSTWVLRKGDAMPNQLRLLTPSSQIGGLNPGTLLNITVTARTGTPTGMTTVGTSNYWFPIDMEAFLPQPITSNDGWGPFEQSVSAGSPGPRSMERQITITDSVHADIISRIPVVISDAQGNMLDATSMQAGTVSGTGMDRVQLFTLQGYDVAQYAWPRVSRDNTSATMNVSYYFQGNDEVVASQSQQLTFEPRAEWLNGSEVTVTHVGDSLVDLTVSTPLPTERWTMDMPLLGRLPFSMGSTNGRATIVHRVTYNTRTGGFAFQASDRVAPTTWPLSGLFFDIGVARYRYNITATDGHRFGPDDGRFEPFIALRRFEGDVMGRANRNLRIRTKLDAMYTLSPTTIFQMVTSVLKVVGVLKSAPVPAVTFVPTFVLHMGAQQLMTLNMGVANSDRMVHIGMAPPVREATRAFANTYPSSLSTATILDVSFGGELRVAGGMLFGMGISLNNILRINNGSTYQGPITNIHHTDFRQGLSNRVFVVVDMSTAFGLFRRELFRGHLFSLHTPYGTPAFQVFPQLFEKFIPFTGYQYVAPPEWKPGDAVQQDILTWTPLPVETPLYYSKPSIDANDSTVALVWTEHALRTNSGAVVLGRVHTDSMSFRSEVVLADNDHGVHDPVIRLLGHDGTSLVTWNENTANASAISGLDFDSLSVEQVLRNENLHAAIVNGRNEIVSSWTLGSDLASADGRADGKATIAVAKDGTSAVIAWPMQASDNMMDIAAVVLKHEGGEWKAGPTTILSTTAGLEDMLHIMPVRTNEFVLVSRTTAPESSAVHAWHYNGTWSDGTAVHTIEPGAHFEALALDGNGDFGVMAVATSKLDQDSANQAVTVRTFAFTSQWQQPEVMQVNGSNGIVRALDVTVDTGGHASVIAEITYPHRDTNGLTDSERDARMTYTFATDGFSGPWTTVVNSKALYESDERVWSLASAAGPKGVIYVVDQELDSTYGNTQKYGNGIQVGPSRINTVLRAFRYEGDSIVSVPFKRPAPVSVKEDLIEKNLRYPCTLHAPYPNPASGDGIVPFVILQPTHVLIDVLDVTGKVMHTLVDKDLDSGIYDAQIPTTTWPQGCYTIRMLTGTGDLMSKTFTVVR